MPYTGLASQGTIVDLTYTPDTILCVPPGITSCVVLLRTLIERSVCAFFIP